ncbi:MAG: OmpP1/FadL family transporter [Hyphomicrobiales bacterium]
MKKLIYSAASMTVLLAFASLVFATNGDNLIGVGPISRAMGGTGIAAPQDAISAVFANPAAMCVGPYCPNTEVDFAGTLFMPNVNAKLSGPGVGGTVKANSNDNVYAIPAIGLSVPVGDQLQLPLWRFGLAAYGVSGLGVDYRGTNLDQPNPNFGGFPFAAGTFSQYQAMRFAPAAAFQPTNNFSIGLAPIVEYSNLDLGEGSTWNYGFGFQTGIIYKATNYLSLGLNYISPRKTTYQDVSDFNGDGSLDNLTLESPQEVGLGVAFTYKNFLVEVDGKWINWSDADGYKDFQWNDQYVLGIGAQYEPITGLFLRAGYNYGKNPLEKNNGFVGTGVQTVQGKTLNRYYYETFRMIGFPAIAEQHVTLGVGYQFTEKFGVNLGFMHAFKQTFKEHGTDVTGQPVTIESQLEESSIDFGLTWRF